MGITPRLVEDPEARYEGMKQFQSVHLTLLFWIGTFLLCPSLLYAGGSQEDPVAFAQTLIADRKYNEAIAILVEVIRTEPERIEEAEELLRTIREIRSEYNSLGQELVDTLENDPENFERAVNLINQMNSLDDNPNPRTQNQLDEARRTAKLQLDRSRRDQIFDDAGVQVAADNFAAALDLYLTGLNLQREEFLADGYSQDIYTDAAQLTATIRSLAASGKVLLARWQTELPAFATALRAANQSVPIPAQSPLSVDFDSQGNLSLELEENLASVSLLIDQTRQFIDQVDQAISLADQIEQRDQRLIDHLVFLRQFIEGRDPGAAEGVGGLLVSLWDEFLLRQVQGLEELSQARIAEARDLLEGEPNLAKLEAARGMELAQIGDVLDRRNAAQATAEFSSLYWTARLLHARGHFESSFLALVRSDGPGNGAGLPGSAGQAGSGDGAGRPESTNGPGNSANGFGRAAADGAGSAIGPEEFGSTLAALAEIEDELAETASLLASEAEDFDEGQLAEYREWESGFDSELVEVGEAQYAAIRAYYDRLLGDRLTQAEALAAQADGLAQGTADELGILARYPDRALAILDQADDLIQANLADQEQARMFLGDFPRFAQLSAYAELESRLNQLQSRRRTLVGRTANLRSAASQQIAQAQQLRDQGSALVARSRTAARSLNLDLARELYDQAGEAFVASISLQQDDQFQSQVDQTLLDLQEEIRSAQNEIVVAEVRELLTTARADYTRGDFSSALAVVTEADELWKLTNTTENQEISRLRDRISLATSLSQERNLSEYDPLYSTLRQFLNLARLDVEEGTRLYQNGNENSALLRFSNAESNITNVLSVKPNNFEARILQIRISQVVDEEEFPELFARKFTDTVDLIERTTSISELSNALTELQVLASINPNYPGLQQRIVQLEIQLGIRPNPLTQARVAESNRLLNQARSLSANTNDEATLGAALNLLQQALELNPDNTQAQILADTIRIRLGGEASFSLSIADTQRFQQAEQLFLAGSFSEAYAITQQLLQSATNQRYPPLLSLNDRILRRIQQ